MELEADGVAEGDLGGVAEDDAAGVGSDGVAALEDFQRAAFVELEHKFFKSVALLLQETLGANTEFGSTFFQTQPECRNLHAKIERDDTHVRGGEACARLLEARAEAECETRSHLISALALLTKQIKRAAKTAPGGEFVNAAGIFQQPITN